MTQHKFRYSLAADAIIIITWTSMRILYLDIDALRPSNLGCYGYHRDTSPNIDAIAMEAQAFRNVYTCDAPCLPSRTAMYSGRFGIQTGVVGHGATAAQPKVQGPDRAFSDDFNNHGLAARLQRAGFHTAMISPFAQRHSAHWFYAGFNEIHNTGGGGMESAEEVAPILDRWLGDNAAKDDWYLHLNLWDVHTPYRVPESYGDPFADEPLPPWLTEDVLREHNKVVGPHTSMEINMYDDQQFERYPRHPGKVTDMASLRQFIDGYDTAIRYVDDYVGRICDQLKKLGIYDDTAIIISADHGENLGELGIYAEHGTADHPTCNIPMIIKWPGGKSGQMLDSLHYNVDLAPTLMELLGHESSPLWDGQSFASAMTEGTDSGHEDLIVSQCAHVCQRSVRWDNWIYVRTYHDGFRLYPQEMLFDVVNDPYEQTDMAADRPELCREGAWRLARWHDAQMQKMARNANDVVDPMWQVILDGGPYHARHDHPNSPLPAYIERLEATGRADGATALRERYKDFL